MELDRSVQRQFPSAFIMSRGRRFMSYNITHWVRKLPIDGSFCMRLVRRFQKVSGVCSATHTPFRRVGVYRENVNKPGKFALTSCIYHQSAYN